jgi:glycosyltransferase involved in cell wall biosynthesis
VSFKFIGDGPLGDELSETLSDEINRGRVELTGWVDHDNVPAELNRLQLLVLPSESEGLPTIVLEALACGTPVYATPAAGVPDVIKESETGFLMKQIAVEVIAEDIERILQDEPLAMISENGRRLIEEEYSYEAAVERYRTILSDITEASISGDS